MAKKNGLGYTVDVDDSGETARDISDDVTNFDFSTPAAVQDVTGVGSSAIERLLLLRDFSVNLSGIFDDGTNLAHDVFKTVVSSDTLRTVTLTHADSVQIDAECLFTDYSLSRSATGELTWTAPGQNADGNVPVWS